MAAPPPIHVSGLWRRFGPVTALADVGLEVGAGEVVSLVGANGAGKSTLLRVLATLVAPDAGTVLVGGVDVDAAPREARRGLGLVLGDERAHYWRLSGRDNLRFHGALRGMGPRAARNRAQVLLDWAGLTDHADRPVGQWSSGQRARLSLARALLTWPEVLLLDEPTRSVDRPTAAVLIDAVRRLAEERGTAVLLVTHDLEEAVRAGDRVVGLVGGRLREASPDPQVAELARLVAAR